MTAVLSRFGWTSPTGTVRPPRSVKYSTRSHTHKCLDIAVRHAYSPHKLHIICCCSLQAEFHGARLRRKHEWRLFHATVQTPIHVAILLKSIISEFARPPGFPPNWVPFPAPHIDSGLPQPDRYLKTYGGDIDLLGRKASCMIMAIRLYGSPPPQTQKKFPTIRVAGARQLAAASTIGLWAVAYFPGWPHPSFPGNDRSARVPTTTQHNWFKVLWT